MIEVDFSCSPIDASSRLNTSSPFRCQLVYTGRMVSSEGSALEFVADPETIAWFLKKLEGELINRIGPTFKASVIHRIGVVERGQVTSFIITEASHHDEAFLVQRSIVECLKHQCPIWKLERNGDRASWKSRRERG